jgi:hypothetical protein
VLIQPIDFDDKRVRITVECCHDRQGNSGQDSWSASFIDDLLRKDPATLSAKQDAKLNEIWDRVTC